MKTVVVLGLGIGNVYVGECNSRGFNVITVDKDVDKEATYTSIEQAAQDIKSKYSSASVPIDATIVCLPNFLHRGAVEVFAPMSRLVIVEKPGLRSEKEWADCVAAFPSTHIRMVRNNWYRPQTAHLKTIDKNLLSGVEMTWTNSHRIPNPGSWFTNESLSFGGVSRDLMPHLLHFCFAILGVPSLPNYIVDHKTKKWQSETLETIEKTDYGRIDRSGVFDVDDNCEIEIDYGSFRANLYASWQSSLGDVRKLEFVYRDGTRLVYDFGLCPNYAYGLMLDSYLSDLDDRDGQLSYRRGVDMDRLVHRIIDRVRKA